jgi:voltage-gated potassium channel
VIALVRRGKVVPVAEPNGLVVETGDLLVFVRDDRPTPAPVG